MHNFYAKNKQHFIRKQQTYTKNCQKLSSMPRGCVFYVLPMWQSTGGNSG